MHVLQFQADDYLRRLARQRGFWAILSPVHCVSRGPMVRSEHFLVAMCSYPDPCTTALMTCSNYHPVRDAVVVAQRVIRVELRAFTTLRWSLSSAWNSTRIGSRRHDGTAGTTHLDDH